MHDLNSEIWLAWLVCSPHFNGLVFKGTPELKLKQGKPHSTVTKSDFPRKATKKAEARKAAAVTNVNEDSATTAGGVLALDLAECGIIPENPLYLLLP